jgi:hypothetical protein
MSIPCILDPAIWMLNLGRLAGKARFMRFFNAIPLYQSGNRQQWHSNFISHCEERLSSWGRLLHFGIPVSLD